MRAYIVHWQSDNTILRCVLFYAVHLGPLLIMMNSWMEKSHGGWGFSSHSMIVIYLRAPKIKGQHFGWLTPLKNITLIDIKFGLVSICGGKRKRGEGGLRWLWGGWIDCGWSRCNAHTSVCILSSPTTYYARVNEMNGSNDQKLDPPVQLLFTSCLPFRLVHAIFP